MLSQTQIKNLLEQKFGDVKTAKDGTELRINCPFCGDDKKFKCWVNIRKGVYHCWRDERHKGKIYQLINISPSDLPKIDFRSALETRKLSEVKSSPGVLEPLTALPQEHPAIEYLTKIRKRSFDPVQLSEKFGVMYCSKGRRLGRPDSSFWFDTSNTLVFPVKMQGIVVGWQARLLYDPKYLTPNEKELFNFPKDNDGNFIDPPKYYTTPFPKGDVLYNFDNAVKHDMVVVVEGVFDAFSVGANAVATFGTGISKQQLALLKTYWDTVVLLLDPDVSINKIQHIEYNLASSVDVITVRLSEDKDAGDMESEEVWRLITTAVAEREKFLTHQANLFNNFIS